MLNIHLSIYATILLLSPALLQGQEINGSFNRLGPMSFMECAQSIPLQDPEVNDDTIKENAIVIPAESVIVKKKSATTALMWSIGTPVVVSYIWFSSASIFNDHTSTHFLVTPLIISGSIALLVSPSAGHIYAHNIWRPILFSSIRGSVCIGTFFLAASAVNEEDLAKP